MTFLDLFAEAGDSVKVLKENGGIVWHLRNGFR